MHRPVGPAVDARSTQQQQQHVVHEPEDFWGSISASLASLGGRDGRAEETSSSVVAVAQEAASHRWRVARFSTTFSSPARLMHESQCRRIMMQNGGGDDALMSVERRDQAEVLIRWQQGDEEMYEMGRLHERMRHRSHPLVCAELNRWWEWQISMSMEDRRSQQGLAYSGLTLQPALAGQGLTLQPALAGQGLTRQPGLALQG